MEPRVFEAQYYALWDLPGGRPMPFGLLRAEGPIVSRWLPGKETWVEAPEEWEPHGTRAWRTRDQSRAG